MEEKIRLSALMKRNVYILILAFLFWGVARLLAHFDFWNLVGLPEPYGYLFQGLLFLGTVFLLQNALFDPYLRVLEERETQTVHKKADAEKERDRAERMVTEYRKVLDETRVRAVMARESDLLAAEEEERRRLKAARERANREVATELEALEGELKQLKPELFSEVDGLARDILNQALTPKTAGPGLRPKNNRT